MPIRFFHNENKWVGLHLSEIEIKQLLFDFDYKLRTFATTVFML